MPRLGRLGRGDAVEAEDGDVVDVGVDGHAPVVASPLVPLFRSLGVDLHDFGFDIEPQQPTPQFQHLGEDRLIHRRAVSRRERSEPVDDRPHLRELQLPAFHGLPGVGQVSHGQGNEHELISAVVGPPQHRRKQLSRAWLRHRRAFRLIVLEAGRAVRQNLCVAKAQRLSPASNLPTRADQLPHLKPVTGRPIDASKRGHQLRTGKHLSKPGRERRDPHTIAVAHVFEFSRSRSWFATGEDVETPYLQGDSLLCLSGRRPDPQPWAAASRQPGREPV